MRHGDIMSGEHVNLWNWPIINVGLTIQRTGTSSNKLNYTINNTNAQRLGFAPILIMVLIKYSQVFPKSLFYDTAWFILVTNCDYPGGHASNVDKK